MTVTSYHLYFNVRQRTSDMKGIIDGVVVEQQKCHRGLNRVRRSRCPRSTE